CHPEARRAIEEADLIILGPGSLFTSIVPNLLVSDIAGSISKSTALKMYVCNVAEQPGETEGYSLMDHMNVLRHYLGEQGVDIVIANNRLPAEALTSGLKLIKPETVWKAHAAYVQADVIDEAVLSHHDPAKLAGVIAATYRTHRGIRRRFRGGWLKSRPAPPQSNGKVHI
ncbi:MAG: 2-phospho-L-lactate transferase CofD family protein, partial [Chloroflexota bacterium]